MEKFSIPFSPPDISEKEINAVTDVLRSGWITTGPRTKEFERRIAQYCRTDKAVALSSATACMELTLRLFGIGEGDEVIVPAYTYTASASVVCHVGATLKFVDVAKGTYHPDYDALEDMITDRTKAIIPVDIAGVMADYDRIRQIVMNKKQLFKPKGKLQEALGHILILADSAHGYGATRGGKISGQHADFTSFSFHAVKNIVTGEGGGLVWRDVPGIDNEYIYTEFMNMSLHGQSKDAYNKNQPGAWEYDIVGTYYKCNLTDIAAAIGIVQMDRYETMLARRRELIEMYTNGISASDVQVLTHYCDEYESSGHLMLVRLLNRDEDERNAFIKALAQEGISSNVHYKPLPMHTAYKRMGFDIKHYPNSYDMYHNEITLPLHTHLTNEQAEYVIEKFNELKG